MRSRNRLLLDQLGRLRTALGNRRNESFKEFALLGAQLLDDVGQEVLEGLGLGFSTDDEGVVLDGGIG